ncbi:MAG: transcriptional repressor [Anaerolineales bacterium]|nr:transcriptional repressor [Anaerolineales bacterium]
MAKKSSTAKKGAENAASDMLGALRQAGMRLTPQRYAICEALSGNREHPTAQVLFDRLRVDYPSLSRATVYNTLHTLVEAGLLLELVSAGDGNAHFDPDLSPHVHLVCVNCHQIDDLEEPALAGIARRVARNSGYELRNAGLAYYGLCPNCQKAKARKSASAGR